MVTSRSTLLCALALFVPLAACGDDTSSPGATTSPTTTDSDATATSTSQPDTTVSNPDVPLPEGCDFNLFPAVATSFSTESSASIYRATSAASEPVDTLQIELYSGYDGVATGVGTWSLDDPNYKTCANCVVVRTGCSGGTCADTYYVDSGSMVIDQWDAAGGRFKGHLENAIAKEVTIATDFTSTEVVDGKAWCLDGYTFDAEVKSLPVSDKTQPTCVEAGTGVLLHDNIANLHMTNCNGDPIELHDTCGEGKALWLIGTAGWCVPCHQFIEGFRRQHTATGTLTRERIRQKTPGLDMLIFLAENNDGDKPSQEFCKAFAEDLKVDPAMIVVDWTDEEVAIPLIDPSDAAIGTHALGHIWQVLNPYLKASSDGSVTTAYPWWSLLDSRNMSYVWSDGGQLVSFEQALTDLLGTFPAALFD